VPFCLYPTGSAVSGPVGRWLAATHECSVFCDRKAERQTAAQPHRQTGTMHLLVCAFPSLCLCVVAAFVACESVSRWRPFLSAASVRGVCKRGFISLPVVVVCTRHLMRMTS